MHALFFVNFLMLKMRGNPSSQASYVSWFPVNLNVPELAVPRKANLFLQCISLSNATLLSIVFFSCGVHRLNSISV